MSPFFLNEGSLKNAVEQKLVTSNMESITENIKYLIHCRKEDEFVKLLRSGLDPNYEGGWPIRLAARYGCPKIVELLIQFGANPHLLSESGEQIFFNLFVNFKMVGNDDDENGMEVNDLGASTLQLAVFSDKQWDTNKWKLLLSCCDSSQLADGAAVAVIFKNDLALKKILATGRCNTNVPTTLTGKTLELLAKGYKLTHLLDPSTIQSNHGDSTLSPRIITRDTMDTSATRSPRQTHRNLSPSVARFFNQTVGQTSLSPTRRPIVSTASLYVDNET